VRDELAKIISERTGLEAGMAEQAATVAIDFIKSKLPPEMAGMLDGDMSSLGGGGGMLGGLFGGQGQPGQPS
jgi:hypothetical protein